MVSLQENGLIAKNIYFFLKKFQRSAENFLVLITKVIKVGNNICFFREVEAIYRDSQSINDFLLNQWIDY